jgi:hypothetical protein
MKREGKLYNFFRGIDWNPCFITSMDHGRTWGEPTHFIASELEGKHRPYSRYAGNGSDTVHVSFTDGHPRNFGNSLYYAAFRGGNFYRADGQLLKSLERGPLRPSEAERVYQGSGNPERRADQSAIGAAWTSCMALDADGHPHIGYSLYLSNADHRYRIASWTGERWVDREVAYAGRCLYDRESSYTGLITFDPVDPSVVFLSTDVKSIGRTSLLRTMSVPSRGKLSRATRRFATFVRSCCVTVRVGSCCGIAVNSSPTRIISLIRLAWSSRSAFRLRRRRRVSV